MTQMVDKRSIIEIYHNNKKRASFRTQIRYLMKMKFIITIIKEPVSELKSDAL